MGQTLGIDRDLARKIKRSCDLTRVTDTAKDW